MDFFILVIKYLFSKKLFNFFFLSKEYKPKAFMWELVKMWERIGLIIVLNIYSDDVKVKGILCVIIVFIYGLMTYKVNPYTKNILNQLDRF